MPENSQELEHSELSLQASAKSRSATKVRSKNPGHVPVIAISTRECTDGSTERTKLKLLVPQDRPGKKFIADVRKRVPLAEDTDEVFVADKKVREDAILSQLDEAYAAEDGFLYVEVRPLVTKTVHFSDEVVVPAAAKPLKSPAEECVEQVSSLAGELKKTEDQLRSKTRDADILQSALELEQEKNRVREQRLVEVVTEVKSAEAASRLAWAEAQEVTRALAVREAQGKEKENTIEALKQELAQAAARAHIAEGALVEAHRVVAELRERAHAAEREVADARDEMELQQAGFNIVPQHGERGGEDGFVIVDEAK